MRISEHLYLVGSEQFGLSHPLDCNCYLIDGGSALGIVDAGLGLGIDDILDNIVAAGFDPQKLTHIIITHSHFGHWGGASELRERTRAQVWAPVGAAPRMSAVDGDPGIALNIKFGRYPAGFVPHICPPDCTFDDGDVIHIGKVELKAILVQGHTDDSMCLLFQDGDKRGLFTGDVVFYGGKLGILNLSGFSLDNYRRDIRKLADLNIDMMLPGHSVFVLRRGQNHIKHAVFKLSDFVMPETFFETNEFMWERNYLRTMTE
jgi:glyoxylase-like metal-dependent hydrolase (beta-lactamase superfamily II)